jgi:hypothetical protein
VTDVSGSSNLECQVAHHVPGRIRLKFPELKGDSLGLEAIAQSLRLRRDVLRCDIRKTTGNIVVHYQPLAYERFVRDLNGTSGDGNMSKIAAQLLAIRKQSGRAARPDVLPHLTRGRKVTGTVLLTIGVAGLLLPIIPGIPFLAAGAALVGTNHPTIVRARTWIALVRKLGSRG